MSRSLTKILTRLERREWLVYLLLLLLGFGSSAVIGLNINRAIIVHDEASQLISAQAFAEGRLSTPTPEHAEFFEIQHVLLEPSYASKYQPGRIIFLAIGIALFGIPHFGMWLLQGLLYPALCWFLRGILPMRWAALGSLVALCSLGFFDQWAQALWGGALPALGGALAFGGAWRLLSRPQWSASLLMGLGVAALMYSRPFEGLLASLVPLGIFLTALTREQRWKSAAMLSRLIGPAAAVLLCAFGFQFFYNQAVTGNWLQFPYTAYEEKYSPLTSNFIFAEREPKKYATPAMAAFYEAFIAHRWERPGTRLEILQARLIDMTLNLLGLFFAGLALFAFWRPPSAVLLGFLSLLLVAIGSYFNISYHAAYYAPVYPALLLMVMEGARRLWTWSGRVKNARLWHVLLGILLVFGMVERVSVDYLERAAIYFRDPNKPVLINVNHLLESRLNSPSLVFVHYTPKASVHLTIGYNTANIDEQKLIYAGDRGPRKNTELIRHYEDRTPYFLIITDLNWELLPYEPQMIHKIMRQRQAPGKPQMRQEQEQEQEQGPGQGQGQPSASPQNPEENACGSRKPTNG